MLVLSLALIAALPEVGGRAGKGYSKRPACFGLLVPCLEGICLYLRTSYRIALEKHAKWYAK